jgi:colicin import membrane protein
VRKELQALQADRAKLEGEVGQLKEEHKNAVDNWKNWAKKAEERKTKSQAVEKELEELKREHAALKAAVPAGDDSAVAAAAAAAGAAMSAGTASAAELAELQKQVADLQAELAAEKEKRVAAEAAAAARAEAGGQK